MPATAGEGSLRLVLRISDNVPQKMNTVLMLGSIVARPYAWLDEQVDIKIVPFNAGLHMLQPDKCPFRDSMMSFGVSMVSVDVFACGNTCCAMLKKSGKKAPLFELAKMVPAGVLSVMGGMPIVMSWCVPDGVWPI